MRGRRADWDLALFVTLLALSIVGDLTAVDTAASRVKLSSSFLAIVDRGRLPRRDAGRGRSA